MIRANVEEWDILLVFPAILCFHRDGGVILLVLSAGKRHTTARAEL